MHRPATDHRETRTSGDAPAARALRSATEISAEQSDPVQDPIRLTALKRSDLFESPPEAVFDRLTRSASHVLSTPVALLSVVGDDKQYFKSFVGLKDSVAQTRQTGLDQSFCKHVVRSGEPLIVDDTRGHHDFAEHPAVEQLDVAAYAGAPVLDPSGQVLGAFCVIDHRPRQWTAEQLEQLTDFAEVVSLEIKLRQRLHAVEQAQTNLEDDRTTLEHDRDSARENARHVMAELQQSRDDVAARDRYLAELGHELRGAVSPAMFAAQMLESDERLPEDLRDLASTLTRNVRQQSELIEAILAGNASLRGQMKLKVAPVDLARLARESSADARGAADATQVTLDLEADGEIVVPADDVRMRQVLSNLIANAIKFTPAGGRVLIRCRCIEDACELIVRDTGAGLTGDMIERIFEPFTQAHTGDLRRDPHGGLGLGLTICRNIVEAHGGTLTAESDGPGTGATFRITMPTNPAH